MAMRHPAPLFLLLTLFILTRARIIQFSQAFKAITDLAIYSFHTPTLTESGGTIGGMKKPFSIANLSNANRGL